MLKFVLYAVIVLVVALLGFIFSSRNETEVALDLFLIQPISLGVGLWVLSSFIIGCVVAWLISWPSHVALKIKNKNQSRKLKNQQDEILRLKGEPAKGN